ncbi:MAG: DNA internalization-related competence protein ComEC/Rec2 [Pasteurellaceae bacterium]|nr:DNA internalization-related competence protein ComEC/Rec2 [Pasteurellaceae bacterium]
MSLDRLSILFVLSLLPLLCLPQMALSLGYGWAICLCLVAIIQRQKRLIGLAILVAWSYFQVIQTAEKADSISATRVDESIHIVQILKQQDYQTAIAKRPNGERIYLNWQAKTPLQLERFYQANFTLRPISSRQNIGNRDRQKWYFAQHIQAIGTVRQAELLANDTRSLRTKWLERTRDAWATWRTQGLLLALAFGERAWIETADWQAFQQTATAHLIAISGLHIALAMGIGMAFSKGLFGLAGRFGLLQGVRSSPFSAKWVGFVVALGYSYLAGFAVPTVRALLAMSLILFCQQCRRHYTPWQYWWRVVTVLLLIDPLALLSDSFWLSVLAVASLILWYQHFPLKTLLPDISKKSAVLPPLWYRFGQLLHLQMGIWLVFSPMQLLFFQGVSPFALLTNLVIVPLYSVLLVPLILFSLLTDNLFPSDWLADQLAQSSLWFLNLFRESWLPLSLHQQWQLLSLNLLILLLLFMWSRVGWKSLKHWAVVCLFALSFNRLPWLWQQISPPPLVQWLHFDVGQGLAMAFVYDEPSGRKAVLYDTGASWQGGSMAEIEILPYLQRQGIDIEAIFISHDDNDHAGGLPSLLRYFPHSRVMGSGQHSQNEPCEQGKRWQFGRIQFSVIYPRKTVKRAKNADSCVLLAQIGKFQLLLTGDAGREQERQFVSALGKVDFLQVGHHGSHTSSSHTLLARIQPDWAVISAGRWNPWRLPNRLVEQRLSQYQVATLNTAKVGMVQIDFFADSYQLRTARHRFSPWYRGYFGSP